MSIGNNLKNDILTINDELSDLLSNALADLFISDKTFIHWEKQCSEIRRQLVRERLRVAVVGPIKSGKSTFINSLLKGDYLKRGAGVVTSVIARIRPGQSLKALLYFKSWDEINAEIRRALVLFPSTSVWKPPEDGFDIRREKDRCEFKNALATLLNSSASDSTKTSFLITNNARNENSVLLASYLDGFDKAMQAISSCDNDLTLEYSDEQFADHQLFVGNDALAVYLKDIQIQIDSFKRFGDIEIADCQGSDSINPLHFTFIQQYLLSANLILYVVSSRTGLRRADIDFLSIIKKMGISKNIMFIINFDFNEHDSYNELCNLVRKITAEIALIKQEASVYAISALFNLFRSKEKRLSPKERLIFLQWQHDSELIAFSDKETERLETALSQKLLNERFALLFTNKLVRQESILKGLNRQLKINHTVLNKDALFAKALIQQINIYQEKMQGLGRAIRRTIDGAVQKIKYDVFKDVDRFFDLYSGPILRNSLDFVKNYQVEYAQYEEKLSTDSVSSVLYLVFQEFKRQSDTFLVEQIHPGIIRFLNDQDKKITEYIESVAKPYHLMIIDIFTEFTAAVEQIELSSEHLTHPGIEFPLIDSIKADANLSVPPIVASMHYSALVKGEALMRIGVYRAMGWGKRIFKKPFLSEKQKKIKALESAVLRMKRDTEKSVTFNFKNYRENLKFQYMIKLIKAYSQSVCKALEHSCQTYFLDTSRIDKYLTAQEADKDIALAKIAETERKAALIMKKMDITKNCLIDN